VPKMRSVQYGSRRFDEVILTQKQAETKCLEWQKILGIQDWAVIVSILRHDNMPIHDTAGSMTIRKLKNIGNMALLDPIDHVNLAVPIDMEKTVVHELLHLVLSPLKIDDAQNDEEEVVIEKLSSALVALKRGQP
jgi:hypothetical protein